MASDNCQSNENFSNQNSIPEMENKFEPKDISPNLDGGLIKELIKPGKGIVSFVLHFTNLLRSI